MGLSGREGTGGTEELIVWSPIGIIVASPNFERKKTPIRKMNIENWRVGRIKGGEFKTSATSS